MPRTKRKETDVTMGHIPRVLPQHVTLVKRPDGQISSNAQAGSEMVGPSHSGDWPTLNLSGGDWDGHPFAPSGMSSGHSQASSGARRYPSETADSADWPNLSLPSQSVRNRIPSTGVTLLSAGTLGNSDEDEDEEDEDEWDGAVPCFEVSSNNYQRPMSVMKSAVVSESSQATSDNNQDEPVPQSGSVSNVTPSPEPTNSAAERFLSQLPPTMSRRLKLIDARGQMNTGSLPTMEGVNSKSQSSGLAPFLRQDGVNYLVVGVIGHSGVGKSAILNWLINGSLPTSSSGPGSQKNGVATAAGVADGNSDSDAFAAEFNVENGGLDFQEEDMKADVEDVNNSNINNSTAHGPLTGGCCVPDASSEDWDKALRGTLKDPIFPVQSVANLLASQAQTQGVDVFVTSTERLILLDTQPINSTCICADLIPKVSSSGSSSAPPGGSEEGSGGGFMPGSEASSLRLASFLLSVCHAVLVVTEESPVDVELLNFVHTAAMLKPSILVGVHSSSSGTCATSAPASTSAPPAGSGKSTSMGQTGGRQKAEEEEDADEEEEEEAGEEEGEKSATSRRQKKRSETTSAAQTDYMAHVFWVMNKVDSTHHWQSGQAGNDWIRLVDGMFRVRPPTEVSVPPPPAAPPAPAAPASENTEKQDDADGEETREEEEETGREGRTRHESDASRPKPGVKETPKISKDGKQRKDDLGACSGSGTTSEEKESERRPRVFCLPLLLPQEERVEHESAFESYKWLEEEFETNARALICELMALPRHHMQSPQAAFTERKWLKFSKDLWDSIPSTALFSDYNGLIV